MSREFQRSVPSIQQRLSTPVCLNIFTNNNVVSITKLRISRPPHKFGQGRELQSSMSVSRTSDSPAKTSCTCMIWWIKVIHAAYKGSENNSGKPRVGCTQQKWPALFTNDITQEIPLKPIASFTAPNICSTLANHESKCLVNFSDRFRLQQRISTLVCLNVFTNNIMAYP